jgi:hypothetical protein
VAHAYDDTLRVVSETVEDATGPASAGTVAFGYDNDGTLTTAGGLTIIRDSGAQNAGLIASTQLGGAGGVNDQRTYNSFGESKGDPGIAGCDRHCLRQYILPGDPPDGAFCPTKMRFDFPEPRRTVAGRGGARLPDRQAEIA